MDVSVASPGTEAGQTTYLLRLWTWIVKVPQTKPDQQFRARFVAAMSLLLAVLAIGRLVWGLVNSGSVLDDALSATSLILLLAIYLLNQRGHFNAAAIGLLSFFVIGSFVIVVISGKDLGLLSLTTMITAASVLLSRVLFPRWNRGRVTALIIAINLLLPFIRPDYRFVDMGESFIGLAAIVVIAMVYENHRAILEREQQSKLQALIAVLQVSETTLRQSNTKLTQQLEDNNVELTATVDEFLRAQQETEQAKKEAERANSVKSAFLASMSHELRTPLNAVINFTRFVVEGDIGPVNEQQVELLKEVIGSAKHLQNLINDVLDMSKIESGSLTLFVEENVNLNGILKKVMTTGKALAADKPIQLELDAPVDLPVIRADQQRILQILLNMMSNACKFTDEGFIKVIVQCGPDEVVLAVEDTGVGIAPEDQAIVFQAFRQTESGLRQGGGTGLGMPISKSLAEAHGGRVWLESEPGKGSTFYLALPIKSETLVPVLLT